MTTNGINGMSAPAALEARFKQAVEYIQSLPKSGALNAGNRFKLKVYALYKQSTEGDCNTSCPSIFSVEARFKWNAWNSLQGMSRQQAMKEYMETLAEFVRGVDTSSLTPEQIQEKDRVVKLLTQAEAVPEVPSTVPDLRAQPILLNLSQTNTATSVVSTAPAQSNTHVSNKPVASVQPNVSKKNKKKQKHKNAQMQIPITQSVLAPTQIYIPKHSNSVPAPSPSSTAPLINMSSGSHSHSSHSSSSSNSDTEVKQSDIPDPSIDVNSEEEDNDNDTDMDNNYFSPSEEKDDVKESHIDQTLLFTPQNRRQLGSTSVVGTPSLATPLPANSSTTAIASWSSPSFISPSGVSLAKTPGGVHTKLESIHAIQEENKRRLMELETRLTEIVQRTMRRSEQNVGTLREMLPYKEDLKQLIQTLEARLQAKEAEYQLTEAKWNAQLQQVEQLQTQLLLKLQQKTSSDSQKSDSWLSTMYSTAKTVVPVAVAGYFAYQYAKRKKWL